MIVPWLFWLSVAGVIYIYIGYPVLIGLLARLRPHPVAKALCEEQVSVVIVACDEEINLPKKLDSLFASSAQAQIHEVIVASDGSTDATVSLMQNYPDDRVKVIHWDDRGGKPAALNRVVPECEAELVILTDARQELESEAVANLLSNFADEDVGVVSGELVFRSEGNTTTAAEGIGMYWKYEKWIRRQEATFRSVPGATGAFYAIRKSLFCEMPESTLLDDVVIPMQAIEQGKRCVFEATAVAYDRPSQQPKQEAIRKRRTIAGSAQLVLHHPRWLLPWRNPIWLQFVSHKISRLFSPLLLAVILVTNVLLLPHPLYITMLSFQGAFYLAALMGWAMQRLGRHSRLFGTPLMFLTLNVTTAAALWDAMRGRFRVTWKRSAP